MKKIFAIFTAISIVGAVQFPAIASEGNTVPDITLSEVIETVQTLILEEDGSAYLNGSETAVENYGSAVVIGNMTSDTGDRWHNGSLLKHNYTGTQKNKVRYYPVLQRGEYNVYVFIPNWGYIVPTVCTASEDNTTQIEAPWEVIGGMANSGLNGPGEFIKYGQFTFTGEYGSDYIELTEGIGYSGPHGGWSVLYDAVKFERIPKVAFDVFDDNMKMYSYNQLNREANYIDIKLAGDSFCDTVDESQFHISGLPAGILLDRIEKLEDNVVRMYFTSEDNIFVTSDTTFSVKISAEATSNCTIDSDYVECVINAPERFTIEASAEHNGNELELTASVINTMNKTDSGVVLLGVYDGAEMIDKKIIELTNIERGTETDISESFDAPESANIKIFVWDKILYIDENGLMCGGESLAVPFLLREEEEKAKTSENTSLTVEVNSVNESVNLSGAIISPEKKVPVVVMLETDDGEELAHFDEILVSDDNSYNYTYIMNNPVDDTPYTVYVQDFGGGDKASFKFYSAAFKDSVVDIAKGKTGDEFVSFIKDNVVILDINISESGDYAKLSDEAEADFWTELEKVMADCDNHMDFKSDFKETVTNMMIIDSLNEADNADDFVGILENKYEFFGILLTDEYKSDFKDFAAVVAEDMKDITYHNRSAVTDDFYDRLLSAVLNSIDDTNRAAMSNKLSLYKNMIGINEKFFGNRHSTYIKYMMGKTYVSAEDIKKKTDEAIVWGDKQFAPPSSGGVSSGGTGGGGGSAGGSKKPSGSVVSSIVTDLPKEPVITAEEANAAFSDLDSVLWAKTQIEALAQKGIVSGKSEKTFAPNDYVTRAEFVKMLVLAFGTYNESLVTESFTDVTANDWFYSYIANAVDRGIIKGREDGSFGVHDTITREDMCVMVYRQLEAIGENIDSVSNEFADNADISDYAVNAVNAMKGAGIVNGVDEETFAPKISCTRAMAAKVIFEACEYIK